MTSSRLDRTDPAKMLNTLDTMCQLQVHWHDLVNAKVLCVVLYYIRPLY